MGIAVGSGPLGAAQAPRPLGGPPLPRVSAGAPDQGPAQRAALASLAAQEALGSRWHLAVLAGPDAGLVLPADGTRVIGRDGVLSDPLVSRRHLCTRERESRLLVGDAGSANGTRWRAGGGLWLPLGSGRRMAEGARLRIGGSLLELRRRPDDLAVASPPAPQSTTWVLVTSLLCAALMVGMGVVAVRTGSRGAMGAVMLAPMALMATMRLVPLLQARSAARRRGHAAGRGRRGMSQPGWRWGRPDPPTMLLALAARAGARARDSAHEPLWPPGVGGEDGATAPAGSPGGGQSPGWARAGAGPGPRTGRRRADDGQNQGCLRAWTDGSHRRRVLALQDGDCLALSGPAAHDALAWWCAQVLARGAARMRLRPGGVEVTWGSPEREHSASLLACPRDQVPARALSVQQAPVEAPSCTPVWWRAACLLQGLDPDDGAERRDGRGAPEAVLLSQVVEELDSGELAERWAMAEQRAPGCPDRLEAVLGVGAHGAVRADLVAHGPHALLAGTTGSGKSELLVAWLLQLALGCAPGRLSLVLVDYKGGAAFGPLARLPHTAGVLTDLDPAATLRALSSLEAEVRRRERLLARYEAKDVAHLPPQVVVPRLVVAVDEFATMAAEHAEVLGALVRVAAQGRSLGIHLILSTQRPQGAISPAVRANTALRVCLRVLDAGDSRDVLGHDGAMRLPQHPGRVLVEGVGPQTGGDPSAPRSIQEPQALQALQAPWCGSPEQVEALVERVTAAAAGGPAPWRPWAPALPARVEAAQAEALVVAQDGGGSAQGGQGQTGAGAGAAMGPLLALTDLPEEQRLGLWHWGMEPPLVVLGAPGSGRSTALASIAIQAAGTGVGVHLCGARNGVLRTALRGAGGGPGAGRPAEPRPEALVSGMADWPSDGAGRECLGTAVGPEDPRRLVRLWSLAAGGALSGDLLCLDDVDALLPAVDEVLGPGEGHALLESLIRTAGASGTHLVLSAPLASASARWASGIGLRLVLGACSSAQASLAGLPHGTVTGRGAGRGLIVQAGAATACQVVLPGSPAALLPQLPRSRREALDRWPASGQEAPVGRGRRPLRLAPLPRTVPADTVPPGTWAVGGDEAAPVRLEPGTSVLVVGPAGSGRSSALAALERCAAAMGMPVGGQGGARGQEEVLVVDDLDRADAGTQAGVEAALGRGAVVLASATTDKAAATYRGPLALLRERGAVVVLWPGLGPAAQVAGIGLRPLTDPRALTLPGRGVLVHRGSGTPLQVVAPAVPAGAAVPGTRRGRQCRSSLEEHQ